MALNPRQRAFVDHYMGNASEAAVAAGYSAHTAQQAGSRLIRHPAIKEAIRRREEATETALAQRRVADLTSESAPRVLSRQERQEQWTKIALDEKEATRDRLKALELLGRSEGDFMERIEHTAGSTNFAEMLKLARERSVGLRVNFVMNDPYAEPSRALPPALELDDAEIVDDGDE